jgi:nitrate reductase NapE component
MKDKIITFILAIIAFGGFGFLVYSFLFYK